MAKKYDGVYKLVRGETIEKAINNVLLYRKKDLAKFIVNNELNNFIRKYANYDENEHPINSSLPNGKKYNKRIPYIGWWWRAVDFVGKNIVIGDCGKFIGFMENNKWGYPQRKLTKKEANKVIKIIWEAKIISEKGGLSSEIYKNTIKKLEELWGLFQTFKI